MVWHEVNITDHRRRPRFEGPYFIWVPPSFDILKTKYFASSERKSRKVYVPVFPEEKSTQTYPYTMTTKWSIISYDEPSEYDAELIHYRYIQLKKGGAALKSMLGLNSRMRPAKRQA